MGWQRGSVEAPAIYRLAGKTLSIDPQNGRVLLRPTCKILPFWVKFCITGRFLCKSKLHTSSTYILLQLRNPRNVVKIEFLSKISSA
jgi:hypothetical protein